MRIKKIMAAILVVFMMLSMPVAAFAAGTPTVRVSSASAKPGETVTLDVAIADNPGINTFSFGFDYDTARLKLTGVALASGIPGQFTYAKKAVWLNSGDITTNGNYLSLTFEVLSTASMGDAKVAVTYNTGDISNYNEEDVNFQIVSGKITVKDDSAAAGEMVVGTAVAAPGGIVTVPVSITKNPGINTFSLGFAYDTSKAELTAVTVADALGGQFTYAKKAVWLNSMDTNYTGEILTLTFKVADNALNYDIPVAVTYNIGDISNYNEDDIYFDLLAGSIRVQTVAAYDAGISLSKVTGRPGETVNVYVSLDSETDVKSMSIYDIAYDAEKLTLTNGEWLAGGSILDDWNRADATGVITYSGNTKLKGDVFCLTFAIREGIADAAVEIGCNFKIKAQNANGVEQEIAVEIVPGCVDILNILRGDVNGDEYVDSDDAICLLYHTMLPERYEINQSGDVNGDGYVNSDDAIYLLYFTLLPDRYPLA